MTLWQTPWSGEVFFGCSSGKQWQCHKGSISLGSSEKQNQEKVTHVCVHVHTHTYTDTHTHIHAHRHICYWVLDHVILEAEKFKIFRQQNEYPGEPIIVLQSESKSSRNRRALMSVLVQVQGGGRRRQMSQPEDR